VPVPRDVTTLKATVEPMLIKEISAAMVKMTRIASTGTSMPGWTFQVVSSSEDLANVSGSVFLYIGHPAGKGHSFISGLVREYQLPSCRQMNVFQVLTKANSCLEEPAMHVTHEKISRMITTAVIVSVAGREFVVL
jgi:hypothetical protein